MESGSFASLKRHSRQREIGPGKVVEIDHDKRLHRAYKNLREGVRDFFIGPGWHRGPFLF
jgi:hypothetical protein